MISQLLRSLEHKAERTPRITIYEASADPSSLVIMIIFIGALILGMLFYNLYQCVVFRGKVASSKYGE